MTYHLYQIPLAEVTSMVIANLRVVGTQKGEGSDPTAEHSLSVTRATTLHPCPCALFFGSSKLLLNLFWPVDIDLDKIKRKDIC